jgi:multidrug resistance efflux pump
MHRPAKPAKSTTLREAYRTRPGKKPIVSSSGTSIARQRGGALRTARFLLRKVATAAIAVVAVLVALVTWDHYNAGPWTRDGRVRVHVASVAPQISGQIRELRIADNQFVHKGDILYVIDPFDFEVALGANKATLQQRWPDLNVKQLQSERRNRLSDLSASVEQKQVYEGSALQAKAAVDLAQEQVRQAEINLQRTKCAARSMESLPISCFGRETTRVKVRRMFRSSTPTAIGSTAISRKRNWRGCA